MIDNIFCGDSCRVCYFSEIGTTVGECNDVKVIGVKIGVKILCA